MIVLDRSVDSITLMTTNYPCEVLIDENIGINLERIKVNESKLTENLNPTITTNKVNNINNNNNQQKEKIVPYVLTTNINKFFVLLDVCII